jgi:hypothetical protein
LISEASGWVKRGRIFEPAGQAPWIGTHAALPVVEPIDRGHRVYFCSRDSAGRSQIGYGELARGATQIDRVSPEPVLRPGSLGVFDDAGVTTSCLVRRDDRAYLYYTGWSRGVSVPFYLNIGLAISEREGPFQRISAAPLLDRIAADPYLSASPWVLVESNLWRMWYVSGTGWETINGQPRHNYHIKYAESPDGLHWVRTGAVAIDYGEGEYAFGRPCVMRDPGSGRYRMWFSVRGDAYRLGYAESVDGLVWERNDRQAHVPLSASGWDSEMITYPVVFAEGGSLHMLYNGNSYGQTGIGLATWALC